MQIQGSKKICKGEVCDQSLHRSELDTCLFFHCVYHKKIIFGHNQESFQKTNDQNEKRKSWRFTHFS